MKCKASNKKSLTTVTVTIPGRKGIDRVIGIDDLTALGLITGQVSVDDLEMEEEETNEKPQRIPDDDR